MLYYKLNVGILEYYIGQVSRWDYKGIASNIDGILSKDRSWAQDDVDYPEAVESAEILAFYRQEFEIDESRLDGQRWVTDLCLRRIYEMCLKYDPQVVGVITTLINNSPYPDAEYHNIED